MSTESLSEHGLTFLEKYFRENDFAIARHHIDSYEQCVFEEIPTIIHASNPIVFLKEPIDKEKTVFAYRVEIFIGGGWTCWDRPHHFVARRGARQWQYRAAPFSE